MTVCSMTQSKVQVQVTRPLKLEILQFSKSISSAIFNEIWQMTTNSETTEQYLTFVWSRFLMSVLVFVSRDFELGRVSVQFANAFAIAITFARWRRCSEATAVTYGTNFLTLWYTDGLAVRFALMFAAGAGLVRTYVTEHYTAGSHELHTQLPTGQYATVTWH